MSKARTLSLILTKLTRLQQSTKHDAVKLLRAEINQMISAESIQLPGEYSSFLNAYDIYRSHTIEKAIPYFIHCQILCSSNSNMVLHLYCDVHLGTIYSLIGQYHQALKHFLAARQNNTIEDENLKLLLNLNVGDTYLSLGDFERVKQYCLKAVEVAEANNEQSCLTLALDNIALAEGHLGCLDNAFIHIERSIDIAQALDCSRSKGFAYAYKARLLTLKGEDSTAVHYYRKADLCFLETYEYMGRSDNLYHYALLLQASNELDLSLERCHQAQLLIHQEQNYQLRIKLFRLEAEIHQQHGEAELEKEAIVKQADLANQELKRATSNETEYIESILKLGAQKREHSSLQMLHSNLKIITKIGQNIATVNSLNDCLLDVYNQINKIIPIHVFGIALYNEEKQVLNYNHFIENSKLITPFTISCENTSSLGAYSIRHQKTLLLNTSSEKEVSTYINLTHLDRQMYFGDGERNQSAIVTPINLNNKTIGALFLEHRTAYLYQSYHCDLAEQLASFIAVSLENQRQTQVLQKQQLELEIINHKLDTLSRQDPLTQLLNRYELEKVVPQLLHKARLLTQPITCLMIDIDFYKGYNDYYGHHEGDRVLVQLSEIFKREFSGNDDYVFRFGGDEFLVLLYGQSLDASHHKVQQVQRAVEQLSIPHQVSKCASTITLSIGGYCWHTNNNNADEMDINGLIQYADEALYHAKTQSRNTFVAYDSHTLTAPDIST
ncbi:sensor domain-containing diguanylate cyclase [Photobacterium sanguinicancri]|uniref:sensor domain-containing diguanylate cyclase n=1 Tax=Photobacterium sanguinicancri TaxID=875932 RepID=UPI0021C2D218|nr:sensor domain-containing diguanylate cyclase [Photobacterium sanguinicancri]